MQHYQRLARVRHDNHAVLGAVKGGAGTRDEIATATGITRVGVALALRRLRVEPWVVATLDNDRHDGESRADVLTRWAATTTEEDNNDADTTDS